MTGLGVALVVALGSAIGCAIVTPATPREVVVLFVLTNAMFWGLLSHFGAYAVRTYQDLYGNRR